MFLPAHDIASYVGEGNVDIGITGTDIVTETQTDEHVDVALRLGFGKCKLCVQAPVADHVQDVKSLAGKRIVTSFPNLTRTFFAQFEEPGKPTSK